MFDIITFGSATLDMYVLSDDFIVVKNQKKSGIFLPLQEKIEGKKIIFCAGGGGVNAAATFANQGMKVSFCGMIGNDFAGDFISREIEKCNINKDFVFKTEKSSTNSSVILLSEDKNLILPYRGASNILSIKDIPFEKLKTKWFYLAPLSGELKDDFLKIIDFGKKNGVKTVFVPGKHQLSSAKIKEALKKSDITVMNQIEASFLTEIPHKKEKNIFRRLDRWTKGICIMTKGMGGVSVSDGKFLYKAKALKTKVADETGAGDSFASGFVAEYIKTGDIISSIQFATANSSANLKKIGAKEGLLKKGQKFTKIKVLYEKL
jgi:sugar/nucleoside kinase (ribokinase family)